MKKIPELLAPAGGMPHLKAAVENGADAVYLGGSLFNARHYAANFDDSEIKKAIEYAHVRGVKVYITLNTLIRDLEIDKALRYACFVYGVGADALIVQDLGLAKKLHMTLPDMPLHFSTQGSIYNLDGAKAAAALGFTRVVLARELSKQEILYIAEHSPIETEIFVHGAMCISYSGQCLMSAVIGGRSGNRGECAQPCRLPYELISPDVTRCLSDCQEGIRSSCRLDCQSSKKYGSKGYLLSLKDMCLIDHLSDIGVGNIKSLKIEGRMKSPEYTAVVTGIYRKYLDMYAQTGFKPIKVDEGDRKRLLQIFNRGGFTSAYFTGEIGSDIVAPQRGKNWGVFLGTVTKYINSKAQVKIKLTEPLTLGDGIEIVNKGLPGNVVTSLICEEQRVKSAPAGSTVWAGYVKGIVKPGDSVYKVTDKELNMVARESYEKKFHKKIPVNMVIKIRTGQPVSLTLDDSDAKDIRQKGAKGHVVNVQTGYISEKAHTTVLSASRIKEQLSKTGDTPFFLNNCDIELQPDAMVPISEINALRKRALEELESLRKDIYPHRRLELKREKSAEQAGQTEQERQIIDIKAKKKGRDRKKISLYYFQWNGTFELPDFKIDRIYLPYQYFIEDSYRSEIERVAAHGIELVAALPVITKGFHDHNMKRNWDRLIKNPNIRGLMLGNLAHLEICKKSGLSIYADSSFNIINSETINVLCSMGIQGVTVSYEADTFQVKNMDKQCIELEQVIFGVIPVMYSAYCPISCKDAGSGIPKDIHDQKPSFYLKDRNNAKVFILTDCNSCVTILLTESKQNADIKKAVESCKADWCRINLFDKSEKKEC